MVIPVCFKCQRPVKIVAESQDGIEIISYQCTQCGHTATGFLLGYTEADDFEIEFEIRETVPVRKEAIHRAKYFRETTDQYKLRARMQGLKALRPKTAGADGLGSSEGAHDGDQVSD